LQVSRPLYHYASDAARYRKGQSNPPCIDPRLAFMSGLGGWHEGAALESPDHVLSGITAQIEADGARAQTWEAGSAAFTVADGRGACAVYTDDAYSLAILGRSGWRGDAGQPSRLDQVCSRFIEEYARRGAAALDALRGEFALVLIDRRARQALIAIDRFGIGNLVYEADERRLVFGSSCTIVRSHPATDGEIDPQSIYDYLYFHAVPAPKTIFRRQRRLLPGHYLTWSSGRWSVSPFWTMAFPEEPGSVAYFKGPFRQALRDAVGSAAAGADCGAFLSGGTDSSTVAGLLGDVTGRPAKTYSIGFAVAGYDEMDYAQIASRHFRTEHHEYYVTADDTADALQAIAAAYDQPFGNASAVAAYYCARMAKNDGVTRMLAGDGGDELFGGNTRYAKQYQLSLYKKVPKSVREAAIEPLLQLPGATSVPLLRKARSYVEQASRPMPLRYQDYNLLDHLGAENVFAKDFLGRADVNAPLELLRDTYEQFTSASLINQMLGIDLKFTLADNDLPKVTRMCQLAGVEVAFPMLDERVVELSARLPAALKLRGTRLRYFFKEALGDYLPPEILRKQKHGFGMPVGAWITTHPRLRELVRDSLSSLKNRGIIAPAFIDRLLSEHLRVHAAYFGSMAWVLMMLELWIQNHATAE
jgi:asparagine synthase (glutamine-hydrolysing)